MKTERTPINDADELAMIRKGLDEFFGALKRLTKADINDLSEAMKEIKDADAAQDKVRLSAALRAIMEILATPKTGRLPAHPTSGRRRPRELEKWIAYVAKVVRTLRAERKWTQAKLAKESGLRQSHISRIESGSLSVSRHTVARLARAFNVPLSKIDPSSD